MLLNLTPHAIVVRTADGVDVTYDPCGTVARVTTTEEVVATEYGAPIVRRTFGGVTGLPQDDTPCLVSSMVLSAIPAGTPGVYAPDTGPTAVRDDAGRIVAVTRLVAA